MDPNRRIPSDLLPTQRNFASGPSLVRTEVREGLARAPYATSHRGVAYVDLQRETTSRLRALLGVPEEYVFVYVPGGATDCMDVLSWSLIAERSAHLVSGQFSSVFGQVASRVAGLAEPPRLISASHGSHPPLAPVPGVDLLAVTLNETSTGVQVCPGDLRSEGCLVAWDGTSAAGGLEVDPADADALFFSPQKCFGAPAGLAVLIVSPAAIERREQVAARRAIPYTLDLGKHLAKAVKHQTLNTPSALTLQAIHDQAGWMLAAGGLPAMAARCRESSGVLYDWAEARSFARPFVADPALRSQTTVTIEVDPDVVAVAELRAALERQGIVGLKSYGTIGQNQLRIATFPNLEPDSLRALVACIDWLLDGR